MPDEPFQPETGLFATDKMVRDWLRKPFKREQIGKLPATPKRPALDYVGHAAVTDRLNQIAPDWHYTVDELFTVSGTVWIRGTMIIGGISRPEYGDGTDAKEAIGNFIRRGAMRFGVAIDLWSKEDLAERDAPAGAGTTGKGEGSPGASESSPEGYGERGTARGETDGDSQPSAPAPGSSPSGDNTPATHEQWAEAQGLGLTGAKVLRLAKARWGITDKADVTEVQLGELIAEAARTGSGAGG